MGLLSDVQLMAGALGRLDRAKKLAASTESFPGNVSPPERLVQGIELEHVHFQYQGTSVRALSDVSLALPVGSTVAIVGENGAGKSTRGKATVRGSSEMGKCKWITIPRNRALKGAFLMPFWPLTAKS